MRTRGDQVIGVATDQGLYVVTGDTMTRVDALAGREVNALVRSGQGWWAIADGRELLRSPDALRWTAVAAVGTTRATCLAATAAGLLIGTAGAHLLRLGPGGLEPIPGLDTAEGRPRWYTPWGDPADVRSIAVGADGAVYVNVHVGGVLRSTDGGATWQPTLDIEHDVHQVLAAPRRPGLVLVAAADGYGRSDDAGETWRWDNSGLHAHYCRAVALAGDTVLLSASAGHHGRRAAVYRRPLDGDEGFQRCQAGLPERFSDNIDTASLAARGRIAAIGSEDGSVFLSQDAGRGWVTIAKGLAPVRAVVLG